MLTFHSKCRCGKAFEQRTTAKNATYVVNGEPVCGFNCYVQFTFGPESDWDCPPERGSSYLAAAP